MLKAIRLNKDHSGMRAHTHTKKKKKVMQLGGFFVFVFLLEARGCERAVRYQDHRTRKDHIYYVIVNIAFTRFIHSPLVPAWSGSL